MLFFTRAFLCIGTIIVLAEGFGPGDLPTSRQKAADLAARAAATQVEALCRSRPSDCLSVATSAFGIREASSPKGDVTNSLIMMRRVSGVPGGDRRDGSRHEDLSLRPAAPK